VGREENIFIAGGTGYIGRPLVAELMRRRHIVRSLVRKGSEQKLPPGCTPVFGDPLAKSSYEQSILPSSVFVQLVGVSHPRPSKASQFRSVDFVSASGAIEAAAAAGVHHFVYLSVAHPAPTMKEYITIRMECEKLLGASGLNATIVRPWYVLGPGHRWPYFLLPAYWLCECLPPTREGALRLGLVTLHQMVSTLVWSIEHPPIGQRILTVPDIRALRPEPPLTP
jgi:uncharacterized protein YbjT (DUF2867 family)